MLVNVEHIGIAVADIDAAERLYTALLGVGSYKTETVESESVVTAFFKVNQTKIELLQATDSDSAIARFIEKRGEGIHHLAFEVSDIYSEIERLRNEGFVILNEQPKLGADNKLVCFIHPRNTNGVLVELCQEISKPNF